MNAELVGILLGQEDYYRAAKAANFLAEPERSEKLREILDFTREHGCLCGAEEAAACLGQQLQKEDLEALLSGAIENRQCRSALLIASRLNKRIDPADAEKLISRAMVARNFADASRLIPYLDDCKKAGAYAEIIRAGKCSVHP